MRDKRHGVNVGNVSSQCHAPSVTNNDLFLHMALLNGRSLANKNCNLNDFFKLDFMLVTESWLFAGESALFSGLLAPESNTDFIHNFTDLSMGLMVKCFSFNCRSF